MGDTRRTTAPVFTFPTASAPTEPLYGIPESERVGAIGAPEGGASPPPRLTVAVKSEGGKYVVYCRFNMCKVRGDEKPSWSPDNVLNGYYLVLTSGTKSGSVYPIARSSDGLLKANDTDPATSLTVPISRPAVRSPALT